MRTLTLFLLLTFTTAFTYSQSVAISQLPAITDSLKQADMLPIVHNGTTRKVTMQQLQNQITGQHTTSVHALSVGDTALFNGSVRINSLPNLTATHLTGIGISDAGFLSFQNSLTTADTSNGNLATVHHADSLIHASILSGATGVTGATGLRGATGINGITGATGINGSNGSAGATGANGATGLQGVTGTNGTNGATGTGGLFFVNMNGDTIHTAEGDSLFMGGHSHNHAVGGGGIFLNTPLTGPVTGVFDLSQIGGSSRTFISGYTDLYNHIANMLVADTGSISIQANNYINIGGFIFPNTGNISPDSGNIMITLPGTNGNDSLAFISPDSIIPRSWKLNGNTGVQPATEFIGTSDFRPIRFGAHDTIYQQIMGSQGFSPGCVLFGFNLPITPVVTHGEIVQIQGSVAIIDGTQGANKSLTSDANGNASWQPLMTSGPTGSEPGSPYLGQFYFDTTLTKMKFWDGTQWPVITSTP